MDELITRVATQMGMEPPIARKAIGAILATLQAQTKGDSRSDSSNNAQQFDFYTNISSHIDGMPELIAQGQAMVANRGGGDATSNTTSNTSNTVVGPESSGIFGLVMTLLKLFGVLAILKTILANVYPPAVQLLESVEEGAQLTAVLSRLGVSRSQGTKMVRLLLDFLKTSIDPDTIQSLIDTLPAVKAYLEYQDENDDNDDDGDGAAKKQD